jgi:large subunit ribosomal protein L21
MWLPKSLVQPNYKGVNKMYAIIATGGKQYKVAPNDTLEVEKLEGKPGDVVEIDVLMLSTTSGNIDTNTTVKAKATIISQLRDKKIVVYKYKPKKNERKKQGHRQPHTKLKIISIN